MNNLNIFICDQMFWVSHPLLTLFPKPPQTLPTYLYNPLLANAWKSLELLTQLILSLWKGDFLINSSPYISLPNKSHLCFNMVYYWSFNAWNNGTTFLYNAACCLALSLYILLDYNIRDTPNKWITNAIEIINLVLRPGIRLRSGNNLLLLFSISSICYIRLVMYTVEWRISICIETICCKFIVQLVYDVLHCL